MKDYFYATVFALLVGSGLALVWILRTGGF